MLRYRYMPETEPKPVCVYPRPEDILTTPEAELVQLADRGELPCPRCGEPLWGDKLIKEEFYEGIALLCLEGCGLREY